MKKIIIPTILAATILVAGMFAFMPIQKASTIHTTFGAGSQADLTDEERLVIATVGPAGAAITDGIILPDNNVDYVGTVSAVVTDAGAGAEDVTIECLLGTGGVTALNAADSLDAVNEKINNVALVADCEAVRVDLAGASLAAVVSVYINEWPEV